MKDSLCRGTQINKHRNQKSCEKSNKCDERFWRTQLNSDVHTRQFWRAHHTHIWRAHKSKALIYTPHILDIHTTHTWHTHHTDLIYTPHQYFCPGWHVILLSCKRDLDYIVRLGGMQVTCKCHLDIFSMSFRRWCDVISCSRSQFGTTKCYIAKIAIYQGGVIEMMFICNYYWTEK